MRDFKDLTREELKAFVVAQGASAFAGDQAFGWFYKNRAADFAQMTNVSKAGRKIFSREFSLDLPAIVEKQKSRDGTVKFLVSLNDRACVESVVIPKQKRRALCLSTQVGCKYNCSFCLSGKLGLVRNMTAGEIVGQYLAVQDMISPEKVSHVVFMGVGEPLDNFDNFIKAVKIISDAKGIGLSCKKITISTCGLPEKIIQLADLKLGIQLSISLHAANNVLRSKFMPVNKKYPIAEVLSAAKYFAKISGQPVTFEYVLVEGINSSEKDANDLVKILSILPAKVNLIPINRADKKSAALEFTAARAFQKLLEKKHLFSTIRHSRGSDILAACGQLSAQIKYAPKH